MEKIILDCDPGHDDAIALIMAVLSEKIDLLAVTTSAGNQLPSITLRNALKILTLLNVHDVPVSSGNKHPLIKNLITGTSMHGLTGLDGADLPEPSIPASGMSAIDLIADTLKKSDDSVTIVVTGPCTNIALFLSVYPELKSKIKQIVVLGGGMGIGNWQPTTEFNMLVDPEAAKIVFDAGVPIVMIPLNVSYKAELLESDLDDIKAIKNPVSKVVSDMLSFYGLQFRKGNIPFKGIPLYDPCTITYLIDPQIFGGKECNVEIETRGELTSGETIIDYYNLTKRPNNALVLFDINRDGFSHLLISLLKQYKK